MKRLVILSLCAFIFIPRLSAQEEPRPARQDGRRPSPRDARGRGGPGGPGGFGMVERIADRLELDDDQRKQFDQIVEKYRDKFDEQRQRFQEIREAQESGDDARAQELREQMRSSMSDRNGPMEAIMEELKPILREDQRARLEEMRSQFGRGPGGGMPDPRQIDQLKEELQLDDQQTERFDEIAEGLKRDIEQSRSRMQDMGSLYRELREARDAGDDEKARDLERKLGEMRPNSQRMMERFFDKVQPILHEDQMEKFNAAKERMTRAQGGNEDATDPRAIVRIAKRLELTDDQKEKIADMEREVNEQLRDARSGDGDRDAYRQAQRELADHVKKDIKDLLDAEQQQQFDRELSRLERSGRGDRGDRGERGRRGGRSGADRP